MQVLRSESNSPSWNAALEELLYRKPPAEPVLLFYRNSSSVLIGRNQNVRREADLDWCEEHGVPIVRRISGGGAVYHDMGNLNYAFIVERGGYSPDKYVGIAIEALRSLGLADVRSDAHHSIWCCGAKVSGSAFALGKSALLHGCILVETDLAMLSAALNGDPAAESAGAAIDSVRVPVVNASSLSPAIGIESLQNAILHQTASQLGCELASADCEALAETEEFKALEKKFSSKVWNMEKRC